MDPLAALYYSDDEGNEERKSAPIKNLPFSHLIFSPRSPVSKPEFVRFLKRLQNGLTYSTTSLGSPSESHIESKKTELVGFPAPEAGKKKTLVLDLDGTLVWAEASKEDRDAVPIEFVDEEERKIMVITKL